MIPVSFFLDTLDHLYPKEICHLHWNPQKPWTLLFAVILSAQCTDKRVNMVTPELFHTFRDLESFVARPKEELESIIRSTGFFRQKAKSLIGSAEKLLLIHNGIVPDTMEELIQLPGVGRKTANVVLWNIFHKNVGFVVDTHIGRIAYRVGYTNSRNPIHIEKDLMKHIPKNKWGPLSHQLIQFGRDTCRSRSPQCSKCPFTSLCPRSGVNHS